MQLLNNYLTVMNSKTDYIRRLKKERHFNKQRQGFLENRIRNNWVELKESVRPINIASDVFARVIKKRIEKNQDQQHFFKNAINYGLILLHKKFTQSAKRKKGIHSN